jgi:hypothetical protein
VGFAPRCSKQRREGTKRNRSKFPRIGTAAILLI